MAAKAAIGDAGSTVTFELLEPHEATVAWLPSERAPANDAAIQRTNAPTAMPVPTVSFNTIQGNGANPPSVSADIGPNHYVVMSNIRFAIYDRSGGLLVGPLNNNTLWAGFGGACETQNAGDPIVVYDQLADRWLMTQFTSVAPFALCIALSVTGDPTGSYYRWSVSTGDNFPDYPKYSLWPDAYYVATREFMGAAGPFVGAGAYALNRADMLAGVPSPRVVSILVPTSGTPYNLGDGLIPADLDGATPPPAGSPAFYLGSMDSGGPYGAPQDALTLWRFHADFDVPANSTFTLAATLPVTTFDSIFPCPGGGRRCIPQPGATTTQFLDILSYRQRFMSRVSYRNFGTHESIACNQSVEAGAGPSGPVAGLRWYELRDPGGAPLIHQQGTYAPGITDDIHRWNGDIAMDHQGNMALGYSVSSGTTTFPGIRYTGRLAGDPLNQMSQGEAVSVSGIGIQQTSNYRWGDYSSLNMDPTDDCTYWYVNEYYPVSAQTAWMLRVSAFKFPGCLPVVGVEPSAVDASATRLAPLGIARGTVRVRFSLAKTDAGRATIDVVDVSGRRVRRLLDETLVGGSYHLEWDRTSDQGEPLHSGVFHVRLRTARAQSAQRVVLLR